MAASPAPIPVRFIPAASLPGDLITAARDLLRRSEQHHLARVHTLRSATARAIRSGKARARALGFLHGTKAATRSALKEFIRLNEQYRRALHDAHHECLALSLQIVREVLNASPEAMTEALENRIRAVLASTCDSRAPRILVHSEDREYLAGRIAADNATLNAQIMVDDSLTRGNAVVESAAGTIHLDWQQHLDAIAESLRHSLACTLDTAESSPAHSGIANG